MAGAGWTVGGTGAATLVDGAVGVVCNDCFASIGGLDSAEKSIVLINQTAAATAAVTPKPITRPREEGAVDPEARDEEAERRVSWGWEPIAADCASALPLPACASFVGVAGGIGRRSVVGTTI